MTPKEQIQALCAQFATSQDDFAKKIGSNQAALAQWMVRNSIPNRWLRAIADRFPEVSMEWLLTGEGEMLTNEAPVVTSLKNFFKGVNASNGEIAFEDEVPNRSTLFIPDVEASYFFPATDCSMEPLVHLGDIIGVEEVKASYYDPSKVYFIVTKSNERFIKHVQAIKGDNDNLELVAENSQFAPMILPKSEILKIFKVVFIGHTLH